MTVFDLVFVVLFLASVATVLAAATIAVRGQVARAFRLLRNFGICIAAYFCIIVAVSLFGPRTVLRIGEPRCFDDWCITVEGATRQPQPGGVSYLVTLRLSSTARRISQRENNVVVYVSDGRGRRYDPVPDASGVPFNVQLRPGESVEAARPSAYPRMPVRQA